MPEIEDPQHGGFGKEIRFLTKLGISLEHRQCFQGTFQGTFSRASEGIRTEYQTFALSRFRRIEAGGGPFTLVQVFIGARVVEDAIT